jgi:hypothetical protein
MEGIQLKEHEIIKLERGELTAFIRPVYDLPEDGTLDGAHFTDIYTPDGRWKAYRGGDEVGRFNMPCPFDGHVYVQETFAYNGVEHLAARPALLACEYPLFTRYKAAGDEPYSVCGWTRAFVMEEAQARFILTTVSVTVRRIADVLDSEIEAAGYDGREAFEATWDEEHPKRKASTNPFVWVVRFELLHKKVFRRE